MQGVSLARFTVACSSWSRSRLLVLLGETLTQRAGIVNLGVEGQMLMGAVVGFAAAATLSDPLLALVAGAIAGLALSLGRSS
jgi:simple sugar transport system permease protein